MAKKVEIGLSPNNLARIGAIDDFYDIYISIKDIYINELLEYKKTHRDIKNCYIDIYSWNFLCRKKVRNICGPMVWKHRSIFTSESHSLRLNAYSFQYFLFLRHKKINIYRNYTYYDYVVDTAFIDFSDFLSEIQYAVSRSIYRKKAQEDSNYTLKEICQNINKHILSYVEQNAIDIAVSADDLTSVTDSTLYIYENLSSTSCHVNSHPIVAKRFIANFASGSGKIALPVHYCPVCNKYFIGKITLSLFEKNYGKLVLRKRKFDSSENTISNLNDRSKLFELGYNVSDDRIDAERQRLLVNLLKQGVISYHDMVRCIEFNIRLHNNHPSAVAKWRRDLKYISDYVLKTKSDC